MPQTVKKMAELSGKKVYVEQVTPGGANFAKHVKSGKALAAIQKIDWDFVVLQNQSFEPVIDQPTMMKYGKELALEIDKIGAKKILYQTMRYAGAPRWVKKMNKSDQESTMKLIPIMFTHIEKAYGQLAKEINARVAPAGKAWEIFRKKYPQIPLHTKDNSHPNEMGSYLSALVIYNTIFKDKANGFTVKPFEAQDASTIKQRQTLEKIAVEAMK